MCSEKDIRPHHTTEKERETQQQTNRWGGVLALRYQTWGSGFAIPDWGLSPGPEGDKRGTHHGGVAGDHEVDP